MKLTIQGHNFPHAELEDTGALAFLAHYYPYRSLSDENWKNGSWSPEILDYKEGHPSALNKFIEPTRQALIQILIGWGINGAYIVPVPSSIASNDPDFKRTPRQKGEPRNRDDRNAIFCGMLNSVSTDLVAANILVRTKSKTPKVAWPAEEHKASLALAPNVIIPRDTHHLFILIDDIYTNGGTLAGTRAFLMDQYPQAKFLMFALGKTRDPSHFVSL